MKIYHRSVRIVLSNKQQKGHKMYIISHNLLYCKTYNASLSTFDSKILVYVS